MAVRKKQAGSKESTQRKVLDQPPPPAYFLSLSVENVRCFGRKQTLDLSNGNNHPARWTVILGDNGVGKTTLLQSLVTVSPVHRLQFLDYLYTSYSSSEIKEYLITSLYDYDMFHFRTSQGRRKKQKSLVSSRISMGFDYIDYKYKRNIRELSIERTLSQGFQLELPDLSDNLEGYSLICYAYGAGRRMSATALSVPKHSDTFATLFSDEADLLNAEEWLLQTDYTASKRSPARKEAIVRRDKVKDILKEILPDVHNIRFSTPQRGNDVPRVEFKSPYGWVGINQLSLGYRTMIAWIVDFASRLFDRYPDSPDPLAEPAVCLVDEIDLHMHPKWQRQIMRFLTERFPNTQFIVTAHSPLIVQAATDANVVVLRHEGDHVVIDNDIEAIRGWRIDQILTSDLFDLKSARPPEYDSLLAERKKILTKSRLTKKDKDRLEIVEAAIGPLPAGENLRDAEAMEIIRRAAQRIKASGD